jgi:hypothetical protein
MFFLKVSKVVDSNFQFQVQWHCMVCTSSTMFQPLRTPVGRATTRTWGAALALISAVATTHARTIYSITSSPPPPPPVNNLTVAPCVLLCTLEDANDVRGLLRPRGSTLAAPPPGLVSPANESVTLLAGIYPNATFEIITIEIKITQGNRDVNQDLRKPLTVTPSQDTADARSNTNITTGGRGPAGDSSATAQRVIRRYLSRDLRTYEPPTELVIPGLRAAAVRNAHERRARTHTLAANPCHALTCGRVANAQHLLACMITLIRTRCYDRLHFNRLKAPC